jgi:hypothetical protein
MSRLVHQDVVESFLDDLQPLRPWFNPTASDLANPVASFSCNSGLTALSTLSLRSANLDSGDSILIDNPRLGSTWGDVSTVPEPSSIVLSALSMFVPMSYRRSRQN